ncbi:hypothetical protein [Desulfonatronovibrio hydrogenovorans]|uniref:hypothetical protein n=1 Tax=Desulfonatronovibrio hydrogenovorans TaxID=53245 RepID=UPI00068F313A|nr:hypothetical protein [Desulfonatronovibrio hydrogenovorans]
MQEKTLEALKDIAEVFKFDLWLRFYFVEEKDDKLQINLDDQVISKFEQEYGHLSRLAAEINKTELNPLTCQKAIVEHILDEFDGKKYEIGFIPKLLDMAVFKAEIQLFNTWAHLHEDQLEKNVLDFEKWKELYDEWKKTENAQKIALSFSTSEMQQPGSDKTN